jgi:hypothetical protein
MNSEQMSSRSQTSTLTLAPDCEDFKTEKCDSTCPSLQLDEPPNGGLRAWLTVVGVSYAPPDAFARRCNPRYATGAMQFLCHVSFILLARHYDFELIVCSFVSSLSFRPSTGY